MSIPLGEISGLEDAVQVEMPGRIAARRLTGYLGGAEIERRQRQLLLSAFHNLEGFAYPALRARLVGTHPPVPVGAGAG